METRQTSILLALFALTRMACTHSAASVDASADLSRVTDDVVVVWDSPDDLAPRDSSAEDVTMFDAFDAAAHAGSPGGVHLSASERAGLIALPRPSHFSAAEWAAMIDRMDSLQGVAMPADVAAALATATPTPTLTPTPTNTATPTRT